KNNCALQAFRKSGRQDLNLRPPGPQPGALPDCATPRGKTKRATGIEPALEAWKASVQPQHFARTPTAILPAGRRRYLRPSPPPRPGPFRSSTGPPPPSPASPGGGHGPNQLSRAPSSVTVEPLNVLPSGEASSA